MSNKTAFKTIREFLFPEKEKEFVIPNYQRGYKWAVRDKSDSAVEKLCDDLVNANKEQEFFLQGVTVVEKNEKVILIDGQQRTTTLYLILWYLKKLNNLKLSYDIRKSSRDFINDLKNRDFELFEECNDDSQDVYYFKKAIKQINEKLKETNNDEFTNFLLDKVTILYIVIDQDKATKTFTMMNGSKATMLQEELVKAEILRRVSLPEKEEKQISTSIDENLAELKEIISIDWETNALRSRYAREWDKWLYWWNRADVQEFFGCKNPLGYLLRFYLKIAQEQKDKNENKILFDVFKDTLSKNGKSEKQNNKLVFKELRDLQKSFEDIYSNPKVHNYLKLSLICTNDNDDKFNIIKFFMDEKSNIEELSDYAKWRLVGATHLEITNPEKSSSESTKEERALAVIEQLSGSLVYEESYDIAVKQLLRLNVEEDNKLGKKENESGETEGRKFDFSIWNNKSLEHIHPKSKAYHKNDEGILLRGDGKEITEYEKKEIENESQIVPQDCNWLNRDKMDENCSEHCIGNLVLLYGNNNSEFGTKSFIEKKNTYFNINPKRRFESRHLLHTISVFAKSNWCSDEIKDNRKELIKQLEEDYGVKLNSENNDNE